MLKYSLRIFPKLSSLFFGDASEHILHRCSANKRNAPSLSWLFFQFFCTAAISTLPRQCRHCLKAFPFPISVCFSSHTAKAKTHLYVWGCVRVSCPWLTHGQMKGRARPQAKINYGKITSGWAKWPLYRLDWDCFWDTNGMRVSPCMWNNMRWILFLQIFHSSSFCELAFKTSSFGFSPRAENARKWERKMKMSWNLNASTSTWCTRLWWAASCRSAVTVTALSGLILPPTSSFRPVWPPRPFAAAAVACDMHELSQCGHSGWCTRGT